MIKMLQIVTLASLSLLLLLPGPARAQEQLAVVENFGDTLLFHPLVEFAELILTVTGPCDFQYRQVVTQGEPLFRLDPTTIDGAYTYDLVRIERVDPLVIEILQKARAKADEEAPRQLCRDGRLPAPPTSQSEGFVVFRGEIVYDPKAIEETALKSTLTPTMAGLSSAAEPARDDLKNMAAADFVIIDDLIVDGSACIGFDCVNGESFGFDTIRLKENNLRIKFDDTSTISSFPRNDWQLTANDSANGGASKFSIDDITNARTPFTVEANARSHSLYVDDGGRIGSRTSTPSTEIHTVDGDTPTLRLQQDGSSGFAPQTWDVAGNETNFFVRDVTNGSTLPFRIRPGAPSSSIDIAASGNVGLGVSSADAPLHVQDNASSYVDGQVHIESTNTTAAERVLLKLENNGKTRFELRNTSGTATSWTFDNSGNTFNVSKVGTGVNELSLDGSGNLVIQGSLTTGTTVYPDFVFEPGYDLMPLADLEAFIDSNGHLPTMPTAEEVLKKGSYNMTELQMKLLQKVEELTLYTLAQEQQLRELNAKLEAQTAGQSECQVPVSH